MRSFARANPITTVDFLSGGGAMGAMMRTHDWTGTVLGDPSDWPQSLRSVVGLLLNSRFPMFVAWGPELGFLYNDAYAQILGAKHPQSLGARFHDIWAEIWPDISPLIDAALAGEATYRHDLPLLMCRNGHDEQTWFTFSYSPVRDESGRVAGMFCACTETTSEVLAVRRRDTLLELDQRLADLTDPTALAFTASELLGEMLGVARVGYGMIDAEAGTIAVDRDWTAPGFASAAGVHQFADYGSYIDELRQGRAVASSDIETDPRTSASPDAFRALGVRAFLDVPVVEQGQTTAQFFVHSAVARRWTDEEIGFVRQFAERTRAAIARRRAEQELFAQAKLTRLIFDQMQSGLIIGTLVRDDDGKVVDWRYLEANPTLGDLVGLPSEQTIGRTIRDVFGPSIEDAWVSDFARVMKTREPVTFVRQVGSLGRWYEGHGFYIDEQRFGVSFMEITERRRVEEALIESEARFRNMADHSPMMTRVTDPDGECTYLNARWYAFTGQPARAGEGRGWLDAVHPGDRALAAEEFAAANAERRAYRVDFRLRRADGEYRWVIDAAAPRFGSDGDFLGYVGSLIDIDERREAEERLRESEALSRLRADELISIYDAAPIGLCVFDRDMHFVRINDRLAEINGRSAADHIGRTVREIVPDLDEQAIDAMHRVLQGEALHGIEFVGTTPAQPGVVRTWRESWLPLRDAAGTVVGITVSAEEITEAKRAEEALRELNATLETRIAQAIVEREQVEAALRQAQKMEAMGQLTGGVAHDFNNLLTPIVGSLDMLQRKGLGGDRERRLIDGALQSAERAKVLVQRLLAFARRQPLQPEPVDISALIGGMADLIASTSGPQTKVIVDIAADIPAAVADANQLEMAILNLAVNARDAMADGGRLTIAARADTVDATNQVGLTPGSYVRLSVADTGIGMDAETVKRAVEPFYSTKGIGRGTGLGLSMAHGLAAQLGGALAIDSKPGIGTRIDLWLPTTGERAEGAPDIAVAPSKARAGTALLVDDEDLVRASTADMLADLGFAVVEADCAEAALRLVDNGLAFDLLVTDHLMPGLNGTDFVRAVHQRHPATRALIISGYAEVQGVAPDLPRLVKPFRQADLMAKLAEMDLPDVARLTALD